MNHIYHYSDLNGFLSIIKNKKLWLSAANNLNDHAEVNWLSDQFLDRLNSCVNAENEDLINTFWELKKASSPVPYICSFSKDGDLLSQWRAYADDGHGIAIGFNSDYFSFSNELPVLSMVSEHAVGISDVIYEPEKQNELIEEILTELFAEYESEEDRTMNLSSLSMQLNQLSHICKNSAFREEKEVRIIHTPFITGNAENEISIRGALSDIQHRVTGKAITTYFELDFAEEKNVPPILDIVLGPKCEISKYDMDMLLSLNGFSNVSYRISSASYR